MASGNYSEKQGSVSDWKKSVILYLHDLLYMLMAIMLVFLLFFRIIVVSGDSMYNTLVDGDYLLIVSNVLYREPKPGDIIVAAKDSFRNGEPIVKRVIATEGQFVMIDAENATVYVSDDENISSEDALDEPYAYLEFETMFDAYDISGRIMQVPKGCVFVLGDNRNNSADSRYSEIGFVDGRRMLGRVILRLRPFTTFN